MSGPNYFEPNNHAGRRGLLGTTACLGGLNAGRVPFVVKVPELSYETGRVLSSHGGVFVLLLQVRRIVRAPGHPGGMGRFPNS